VEKIPPLPSISCNGSGAGLSGWAEAGVDVP
jgi:hypothetical protein